MLDNNGNEIYEQANCNDFVMDAYTEYGQHVNGSGKSFIEGYQEGRMFLDILDGLKISYRHGLQALWEAPNKFTKTVAIVGDELKKYHFTGDASVPDVLYSLVNDYKCVEIQGESGSRTMTVSAPPAACFTADTKIPLRDGRTLEIWEIVEEFEKSKGKKPLYVMSCDKNGKLHSGKITNAQLTGERKVIRITLDNLYKITCTPDHRFMLRDGTYKEAKDLTRDDSLMPLYSKWGNHEELLYHDNFSDTYVKHHYIDFEDLEKTDNAKSGEYYINIHHKDRNHYNDNPENLIVMSCEEHLRLHQPDATVKMHEKYKDTMSELAYKSAMTRFHENMTEDECSDYFSKMSLAQSSETRYNSRKLLHKNWCIKMYRMMLEKGHKPEDITEETWDIFKEELNLRNYRADGSCNNNFNKSWRKISEKYFPTMKDLKEYEKTYNHRIVDIEYLDEKQQVFDITVDKYENFALEAGVFVHNCRYTELMLKPAVRDQLDKLMPYVPSQTTITGYQEKRFIATPIPLGLIAGSNTCMGIGIANTIPAFTATSMLEAYLANDYTKLKMNFGYSLGHCFNPDLWYDNNTNKVIKDDGNGNWIETDGLDKVDDILDYNDVELKNLWEEGKGSLQMGIPMYYCEINSTTGIMCVCDPKWFTVSISNKITEWEQDGFVEHFDLSADGIGKMFFRITDGTRKVKLEDLKDELWWNCIYGRKTSYVLNIAVNGTTGRVALKEWIDFTYKNYSRLYQNYINNELNNLNFMEKVWNNFVFVADKLVHYKKSEMSDEDIVKACNTDPVQKKIYKKHPEFKCDIEVVKYVGSKTFNFLRSDVDIADRIQKIHDRRDYFNNINIDNEIVAFVDCWDNL